MCGEFYRWRIHGFEFRFGNGVEYSYKPVMGGGQMPLSITIVIPRRCVYLTSEGMKSFERGLEDGAGSAISEVQGDHMRPRPREHLDGWV